MQSPTNGRGQMPTDNPQCKACTGKRKEPAQQSICSGRGPSGDGETPVSLGGWRDDPRRGSVSCARCLGEDGGRGGHDVSPPLLCHRNDKDFAAIRLLASAFLARDCGSIVSKGCPVRGAEMPRPETTVLGLDSGCQDLKLQPGHPPVAGSGCRWRLGWRSGGCDAPAMKGVGVGASMGFARFETTASRCAAGWIFGSMFISAAPMTR